MAGEEIVRLKEELGEVLFDPDAPAAPELVAVPVTATFNDVQNRLDTKQTQPDRLRQNSRAWRAEDQFNVELRSRDLRHRSAADLRLLCPAADPTAFDIHQETAHWRRHLGAEIAVWRVPSVQAGGNRA
jgi:hypothetical protein